MIMNKIKQTKIKQLLVATILTASLATVVPNTSATVVYANQNQTTSNINARLAHLNKSITNNYLGIKNQGVWEGYIRDLKPLVNSLPNSAQKTSYRAQITQIEKLILAMSRINQVEKSMSTNANVIRNTPTWELYLQLAKPDLDSLDKKLFSKQHSELSERLKECENKVYIIKGIFEIELQRAEEKYLEAYKLQYTDPLLATERLKEAEVMANNLNTHVLKDQLVKKIETLKNTLENMLK